MVERVNMSILISLWSYVAWYVVYYAKWHFSPVGDDHPFKSPPMNLVSVDNVDQLKTILDLILGPVRAAHWIAQPFEPCCVVWRFDDSTPAHLRVFDIVLKRQMTPEYWIAKYDEFKAAETLRDAAKASGRQWTDYGQ